MAMSMEISKQRSQLELDEEEMLRRVMEQSKLEYEQK